MRIVYNLAVYFYRILISFASLFGNKKATLWLAGRKKWKEKLKNKLPATDKQRFWFHCASLGEFEQGRPLIEKFRKENPEIFILLSFFSPSGYELRKDYDCADVVCYLPADTRRNAREFIQLTKPSAVIFIKYEFWLHYFEALKKNNIPLYLVSAAFRKSQPFFKWYGGVFRRILSNVNYFFVQDNESAELLQSIGYTNVDVTGDTRFDRVTEIKNKRKSLPVLERFCRGSRVIIAGSTWPEDEDLLLKSLNLKKHDSVKLVIAPHEISESHISALRKKWNDYFGTNSVALYSSYDDKAEQRILIIDNIGLLSSVYSYAEIALVGGGFGKGIHNVLEAAVYGIPVIFGPKYENFREAILLLQAGGGYSMKNVLEASQIIDKLLTDRSGLQKSSSASSEFVEINTGATDKIYTAIRRQMLLKSKLDDISV